MTDTPPDTRKPTFDAYALRYDDLHRSAVSPSGEDSEYFALYKLACLTRAGVTGPVLDYGCGIGKLTAYLTTRFEEVHGTDVSDESLRIARQRVPRVRFWSPSEQLPEGFFETVVLSCVLHHVPVGERTALLENVYAKLRPGGRLVIFEHNPLNPVTRKVVRDCEFDAEAVLLWPGELKQSTRSAGFEDVRLSYIVFFPRFLTKLRPLEPHLSWLCAGAQTMTIARRPA
jgi:SAM-dependent methyltransferase